MVKRSALTNAHVVSNARLLTVEKEHDPKKYVATVEHIGHDCDLALLKVEDPDFWKDTKPLALGGVPEIATSVSAYGYPIGGERLSVTQGIVSRIDLPLRASGWIRLCIRLCGESSRNLAARAARRAKVRRRIQGFAASRQMAATDSRAGHHPFPQDIETATLPLH